MDSIGEKGCATYNRALGLALYNGANPNELKDSYNIALWFEGAPAAIKKEFLDEFNQDNNNLRVCSHCGRFMYEGYLLDLDACSFDNGGEVGHLAVLECGDIVPGGLDDRFAAAVLEGVVGGDGEAYHLGVADVLDVGIPDDSAEDN